MHLTEVDEAVRRNIDKDIEYHLQAVIDLRRHRNSFTHINCLPFELLSEIFSFCQEGLWDHVIWQQKPKNRRIALPLRWIYLSAVCHYWRQVAVQTSRLWARINLDYPTFAKNLSMVLANQSPLHLTATKWSSQQIALLNEIYSSIDHVHSIDWTFNDMSSQLKLGTIPAISTPLRSIRITRGGGMPLTSIASIFAECIFPSIQRLELVNCIYTLPASLLGSTLKHLILRTDLAYPISFATLIDSLSRMSQLEALHLEGVAFDQIDSEHASNVATQELSLPNLRQLVVHPPRNTYQDYFPFLGMLELPADVQLNLKFTDTMPDKDLRTLLCITLKLFRPLVSRTLALCNTDCTFVIGLWNDVAGPEILDKKHPVPHCGLWLPPFHQDHCIVWEEFIHVLDLRRVESIHFGGLITNYNAQTQWKRLLRTSDALKSLSLKGEVARTVVRLLFSKDVTVVRVKGDTTIPKPPAPNLKTIRLLDLAWHTLGEAQRSKEGTFMEDLLNMLSQRAEADVPLEKLIIERCRNLNKDTIGTLDEKVLVDWDGHIVFEEVRRKQYSYRVYDYHDSVSYGSDEDYADRDDYW
ncbi:hypothetical protein QCA50_011663 [Cerrena zonata]|uniref:F-box domain-containing protein n=1 Tax=Cerrena zonata TaxID=2478898 RepID=A0AAW0G8D6_9APHY